MSGFTSSLIIFGLFVLLALPALFAVLRRKLAGAAIFYSVLLFGLGVYHAGAAWSPGRVARPSAAAEGTTAANAPADLCEQVIDQTREAGLIVDDSNPTRVVVNQELWSQIPEEAQNGISACFGRRLPASERGTEVEIVVAPPRG